MSHKSELKKFLDELNYEELAQRLDLALAGANLGIWDWDLRDNSIQFDARWGEMLGIAYEDLRMDITFWQERVHPDDMQKCYDDIQKYLSGDTDYYENIHRMKHQEGHWVYILDRGRISDWDKKGNPIRFTGTHFDITNTEKAKSLLENEHRRFKTLINNLSVAVAMFDRSGHYMAASTRWRELYSTQEIKMGDKHLELFPEDKSFYHPIMRKTRLGKTVSQDKVQRNWITGDKKWLRWQGRPWKDYENRVGGFLVTIEDITTQVLADMNLKYNSKMVALGEMAGGIAHEINNPLAVINSSAEALKIYLEDPIANKDKIQRALDNIDDTAERISKIVRGLKVFSREGQSDYQENTSLELIVGEALNLCSQKLQSENIKIIYESNLGNYQVRCNPVQISQIILNLIHNSKDALDGQEEKWIQFAACDQDDENIQLLITDSGSGIPDEVAENIMNPFFTTKEVGEGTGLGLSVSRGLAESNGGSLVYNSDCPNTQFILRLKKAPSNEEQVA